VTTVTPVANMPSVRRRAITGVVAKLGRHVERLRAERH